MLEKQVAMATQDENQVRDRQPLAAVKAVPSLNPQPDFKQLLESVPGMLYQAWVRTNGSLDFVYVSAGCQNLVELEPASLQQNNLLLSNLVHPEDRQIFDDSIAEAIATTTPWQWEGRLLTPSGQLKWVSGVAQLEHQANGGTLWNGLLTDISDRKDLEIALQEQEMRWRKRLKDSIPSDRPKPNSESIACHCHSGVIGNFANSQLSQHAPSSNPLLDLLEVAIPETASTLQLVPVHSAIAQFTWEIDASGIFTKVSGEIQELLGYEPAEAIGKTPFDFTIATEAYRVAMQLGPLVSARQPFSSYQSINRHKYGYFVSLETAGVPCFDRDRTFIGYRGISKLVAKPKAEITRSAVEVALRQFQEESASRELEQQYKAVVQAAGSLMICLDANFKIVEWNQEAERLLGWKRQEAIGHNCLDLCFPSSLQAQINDLERRVQAGELIRGCEIAAITRSGNDRLLLCNLTQWKDKSDRAIGTIISGQASGDRQQQLTTLETALAQEQEISHLKTRFMSMISHECRTPLSTILSAAELLQYYGHQWSQGETLEQLQMIQSAVQHLTQLLDDVLLIGRAEVDKLPFNPVHLDLAQFCRQRAADLQLLAGNRKIVLTVQGNCVGVMADEKLLRQILTNLLSNAIKYSPDGSQIFFDLHCSGRQAVFTIQDSGIGIPLEDQQNLFEAFYRAPNVSTIPGTGLGLAIVKKCVEVHGGQISFNSTPGIGTTFTIALPLHSC